MQNAFNTAITKAATLFDFSHEEKDSDFEFFLTPHKKIRKNMLTKNRGN